MDITLKNAKVSIILTDATDIIFIEFDGDPIEHPFKNRPIVTLRAAQNGAEKWLKDSFNISKEDCEIVNTRHFTY